MKTEVLRRNNVRVIGEGEKTIMFAHGFGCDQNMWRYITPAFENDYKIILFDYVGCGLSDISSYNYERYISLNGYAQDIIDVCKELDLKDIIFIGHSVSSMTGIIAVNQFPEIFSSMVLIGPSPCYINEDGYQGGFDEKDLRDLMDVMERNYLGWASFLAPVVMQNENRPELSKELEGSFCSTDPLITKRFAEATFFSDNRRDLSKIKLPTLILQCSEDAIAPDFVGEFTSKNISGSKIVKMEATGHCPHLSHPAETIEEIKKFLTETYRN